MRYRRLLPVAGFVLAHALVGSVTVVGQRPATTPAALMGAAQHQEEVEGNLDAAIATYRKVADDPKAPRTLAASALLQIGRLHEKRGSREATRAYERIAKEFADQATIVAQARVRLTALGTTSRGAAPAADTQVVARQVLTGRGDDAFGRVSSDGRAYVYVDWTSTATGNVAVRDLASGNVRQLTQARSMTEGYADSPAWSADGKRIAYVWAESVVKIIGSDGSGEREVFKRPEVYPSGLRWSPDGRLLAMELTTFRPKASSELAIVAIDTGQVTRSISVGTGGMTSGGFSPDGRRLLYGLWARDAAGEGAIHVLDMSTGDDSVLVRGPGRYVYPTWSPDGNSVVFLSDRGGTMSLWSTALVNGKVSGEPRLVRQNIGELATLEFSRDGTLWYGLASMTSDVYVCDFDPSTLAIRSTPTLLSQRFLGANSGSAWSPDGAHIAFMRGTDRRKRAVAVRNVASGDEQELTAPFSDTVHASNWGPTWLPDGRGVLVSDVNFGTSRYTVHELRLGGAGAQVALDGDLNQAWPHVRISPDGQALFFTRREPTSTPAMLALVRRERASGQETILYRSPSLGAVGLFGLAVSPDGASLAFSQNTGDNQRDLIVVPAAGGQPRLVYRGTYAMPLPGTGGWTPDGRHLLITGRGSSSPNEMNQLWAVPVEGGQPRPLGLQRRGGISAVSLSPDGKRLAFTGSGSTGELWSLTNVLSATVAAAR